MYKVRFVLKQLINAVNDISFSQHNLVPHRHKFNVSSTNYKCVNMVISEICCNFKVLIYIELQTKNAMIAADKIFHFVQGNSRNILSGR